MCFAPQRRALFRGLNFQKWSEPLVLLTFWLPNVLRATTACTFSTSQLPKVVRHWGVLYILTSKCASRHNGVFWTSQLPKVVRHWGVLMCLVHFDFEMCFAPQRRALFRHLNFQKWSDHGVFCTFCDFEMCFAPQRRALFRHRNFQKWSENGVLCHCTFWLRNVLRASSRHNAVHFFHISTSKGRPTLRCFVHFDLEMCFAPQRRAIFHLSSGQLAPHPPL